MSRHPLPRLQSRPSQCLSSSQRFLLRAIASFAISFAEGRAAEPIAPDGCVSTVSFRRIGDPDDTRSLQRAVSTGRCVHLSGEDRELIISSDIVINHPNQLIYGDGRLATRIRSGDSRGFKHGMFVAATGEPGPIFRDFGVFYNQPDTSDPKALITYPPAFAMSRTPRFRMEHMGCYVATVCVEAKENSGGAILEDVQMTAFRTGIDIDDAYDSMRLENVHWGPFYLTDKQRLIFLSSSIGHAVGIRMGRVDDFHVVDGTFFGGQGMEIRPSAKDGSVGFGSIRGCDFDNYSGLAIYGIGSVNVVGNEFTLGEGGTSIRMEAGIASVVGNKFLLASPGKPVVLNGGSMTLVGNNFAGGIVDASLVTMNGVDTRLALNANLVEKDASRDYIRPIFQLNGGTTVAIGNVVNPLKSHSGIAFDVSKYNASSQFIGNSAPGWQNKWPRTDTSPDQRK